MRVLLLSLMIIGCRPGYKNTNDTAVAGDTDADGRSTDGVMWQTWSFTTKAYAAAMAPRMASLMKDAASMSESPVSTKVRAPSSVCASCSACSR